MRELFIETKRLIISPLAESNYENITKLYADLNNDGRAAEVFGNFTPDNVKKGLNFGEKVKTGFNLMAKQKEKNEFIGYLKGGLLDGDGFWIYTFAIEREKRREGYGCEFIKAVEERMRIEYGVKYACLSAMDVNNTANVFWAAMGYDNDRTLLKSGFAEDGLSKINIYVKLF